ncbi:MAG: thiamine phosphate synthase [Magnetococcales bacterium]|nr:thiamine phosphate synthase [Magnetococcales bacterium]MBF0156237.1 thiamine phosphate synthase [Magnetococcales bacterium]
MTSSSHRCEQDPGASPPIAGIYPILDYGWLSRFPAPWAGGFGPEAERFARLLGEGGASIIQLRAKTEGGAAFRFMEAWTRILRQQAPGLTIIVNDRVDLALALGADGVHVGQADLPVAVCRKLLGMGKLIGLSTHTLAEVAEAEAASASGSPMAPDYLGFGPIYATDTKSDTQPPCGLEGLSAACRATRLPIVAIGGIDLPALPRIAVTGSAAAAMISAIFTPPPTGFLWEQAREAWHSGTVPP